MSQTLVTTRDEVARSVSITRNERERDFYIWSRDRFYGKTSNDRRNTILKVVGFRDTLKMLADKSGMYTDRQLESMMIRGHFEENGEMKCPNAIQQGRDRSIKVKVATGEGGLIHEKLFYSNKPAMDVVDIADTKQPTMHLSVGPNLIVTDHFMDKSFEAFGEVVGIDDVVGTYTLKGTNYERRTNFAVFNATSDLIGQDNKRARGRVAIDCVYEDGRWRRFVVDGFWTLTKDIRKLKIDVAITVIRMEFSRATNSRRFFGGLGEKILTRDGVFSLNDVESEILSRTDVWTGLFHTYRLSEEFSYEGYRPHIASTNKGMLEYAPAAKEEWLKRGRALFDYLRDRIPGQTSEQLRTTLHVFLNRHVVEDAGREIIIIRTEKEFDEERFGVIRLLAAYASSPTKATQVTFSRAPDSRAMHQAEAGDFVTPTTASICNLPPVMHPSFVFLNESQGQVVLAYSVWSIAQNTYSFLGSAFSKKRVAKLTAQLGFPIKRPVKAHVIRVLRSNSGAGVKPLKRNYFRETDTFSVMTNCGGYSYEPLAGHYASRLLPGERSCIRVRDGVIFGSKGHADSTPVITFVASNRASTTVGPNKRITYMSTEFKGLFTRVGTCAEGQTMANVFD